MASGKLRLPRLISDGMVIQRDKAVKIWGWAGAGDIVAVKLTRQGQRCAVDACSAADSDEQVHVCTAGVDGRWEVLLQPLKAGSPYTMTVSAVAEEDAKAAESIAEKAEESTAKPITEKAAEPNEEPTAEKAEDPTEESAAALVSEPARDRIIMTDILAGDVWVCSGQSNMQTPVLRVIELFEKEIAESCNREIRYFQVPERYDFNKKHDDLAGGSWVCCDTPEKVMGFSAVALFFAAELHKRYNVPVGIINSSVGGSPIEAWMSEDSLADWPDRLEELARCKDDAYVEQVKKDNEAAMSQWFSRLDRIDAGLDSSGAPLFCGGTDMSGKAAASPEVNASLEAGASAEAGTPGDADVSEAANISQEANTSAADKSPGVADASGWTGINIPTSWADNGLKDFYGSIWLRKSFVLPAEVAGKEAILRLGTIVDSDVTYVNGVRVGAVTYRYPPRKYVIPAGITKEGVNTITVRVVSNSGDGGFIEDKPYRIEVGETAIDLTGRWEYRIGAVMEAPLTEPVFFSWKPAGLYNGMIAPLHYYAVKGIAWYQGESNTHKPGEYFGLFKRMIEEWRKAWRLDRLPFLYVQLHNWQKPAGEPGPSRWAELRETQMKALSLPDTGMAVAIDAGEWNDIHPLDKMTVAKRLALTACRVAYGEDIIASGPIYKGMVKEGNRIIIRFREPTGGLASIDGKPLRHFAVAGPDRRFVWARAQIEGDSVVVWNDDIDDPAAVRYAWADNPEGANLYNRSGLPASPFRTDDRT